MPRLFTRLITFHVEGEIYDMETKAEDIIKNYQWHIRENGDGKIHIVATHSDNRGKINKLIKLPVIKKCKKPDTEYFLI